MQTGANRSKVRVAVVGVGYWGKNLVRNFYELGALEALCDPDTSVAEECERKYQGVRFHSEFSEVLADTSIDAVVLATPAASHYEMAKAALDAGKDVLVEKPLAIDVKDGEHLVQLAKLNRRILMVGHILRYHPAILKLQKLIQEGALGKIDYLYSNRLNIGKIRTEENILWSFAPHDISVMLSLLNEMPTRVTCQGAAYLNRDIPDVTLSHFEFPSGVHAHIFVSWLHPIKEQRLVVIGSEKMAVFDDTAEHKLVLYPHKVEWRNRIPTAVKKSGEIIALEDLEPLRVECQVFLDSVISGIAPVSDGAEGLRVLRVLDTCQIALHNGGVSPEAFKFGNGKQEGSHFTHPTAARTNGHISLRGRETVRAPETFKSKNDKQDRPYFVHESAYVDEGAEIGAGSKVWHFSHIMKGARIGERCIVGQNVNIDGGTIIGSNVKIQNNISVYTGVVIEDDVFLGPSCVLTNVTNPRSQVNRHSLYETTCLKRGCTVGANATIVCGVQIGRYAFVGAGSVVTKDVPDFGLVVGNPASQVGWMSRHGHRLESPDSNGVMVCPESGYRYQEIEPGVLRCLDLDEEAPLPADLNKGTKSYRQLKEEAKYACATARSEGAILNDQGRSRGGTGRGDGVPTLHFGTEGGTLRVRDRAV
jgi:UDP-2-acetamido-3-amino-2,3-dideoxy-glucuronate N-acetyltransferase